MKDEQKFEIERAFDLLPHVVGGSWATIWFRLNQKKNPTREEFREKVIEYFKMLEQLSQALPNNDTFKEMNSYIKRRYNEEIEMIRAGDNKEIEKRYQRYMDYA